MLRARLLWLPNNSMPRVTSTDEPYGFGNSGAPTFQRLQVDGIERVLTAPATRKIARIFPVGDEDSVLPTNVTSANNHWLGIFTHVGLRSTYSATICDHRLNIGKRHAD